MKSFEFRLDQALRWRRAQVEVRKAQLIALGSARARAEEDLAKLRGAIGAEQALIRSGGSGSESASFAAFESRTARMIPDHQGRVTRITREWAEESALLQEALRRARLLEKFRERQLREWQSAFDRELELFAGESFLGRLQSKKRAGA